MKEWTDVEKAMWILENDWTPDKLVWISAPPYASRYSESDEEEVPVINIQYIPSTAPPWWTEAELGPFDKTLCDHTLGRWSPRAQRAFEKAKKGMRLNDE